MILAADPLWARLWPVALLLALLAGCTTDDRPAFRLTGDTMGTRYHITVVADVTPGQQSRLQESIDRELLLINQQMSTYLPDSELSQLNNAPVGEPVTVSPALFDVLALGLEVSWLTGGAFDYTVGGLVDLWGFGPVERLPEPPAAALLAERLASTGFQQISLNLGTSSVTRATPVSIDLSAIAKGYAVDVLAEQLAGQGFADYMVEIGGEIRVSGRNPGGRLWQIAVEQPDGGHSVNRVIPVSGVAIATSGDYRNYFEQDGKRYSHTIDPRTGYPITHRLASVTVVANSAAYADAMATAMMVLGPEAGQVLAGQLDLAIYQLIKSDEGFVSWHSDAFSPYLQ